MDVNYQATGKMQDEEPKKASLLDPGILLTKLSAGRTWSEYQTDEPIFSQGEAANAAFYIRSGKVKLTVTLNAEEAVISILPEGSFILLWASHERFEGVPIPLNASLTC